MKTIMTIGGTDSSGGAGLTRDCLTARDFGNDVFPVVTAVTAQSNGRMFATQLMPPDMVATQIRAALDVAQPAAVKIGMLGTSEIADAVAAELRAFSCPVIIDPVLKSSSGGDLMSGLLPPALLSQTRLITPNLPEAASLAGDALAESADHIATQAQWFLSRGVGAVLVKGGHATGDTAIDTLFDGQAQHRLAAPRLRATLRGTGCTLATAIACELAEGRSLLSACKAAKMFVHARLEAATSR